MADVTDATFMTDVIERSKTVPVVVDLWAEWCGPCKALGPILEKVVAETGGLVELAKVDVDANPEVSQAFQVQSIPAVYAMAGGQVVSNFIGAKGEDEVREFVQALIPEGAVPPADAEAGAGEPVSKVAGLDEAGLRALLVETPDDPEAVTALAAMLVDRGEGDEALTLLAKVPETPETRRISALARTGGPVDDIDTKLEALLATVKGNDDARQEFVDLLEVLGAADPRTAEWRKRLTSALF